MTDASESSEEESLGWCEFLDIAWKTKIPPPMIPQVKDDIPASVDHKKRRSSCDSNRSKVESEEGQLGCIDANKESRAKSQKTGKRRKTQKYTAVSTDQQVKMLSCPYFKRHPCQTQLSRACSAPGWPTVHRLK
jgi:hypothetical protein